jgi:hypothetical protein
MHFFERAAGASGHPWPPHAGGPLPVSYRAGNYERQGVCLHGRFCVVPAGAGTRAERCRGRHARCFADPDAAARDRGSDRAGLMELAPSILIGDPQVERIGWMMQAEGRDGYPAAGYSRTASTARCNRSAGGDRTVEPRADGTSWHRYALAAPGHLRHRSGPVLKFVALS